MWPALLGNNGHTMLDEFDPARALLLCLANSKGTVYLLFLGSIIPGFYPFSIFFAVGQYVCGIIIATGSVLRHGLSIWTYGFNQESIANKVNREILSVQITTDYAHCTDNRCLFCEGIIIATASIPRQSRTDNTCWPVDQLVLLPDLSL